ncbi:A/G-specific adenine glycosylase [Helicobacter turcicus]|uniref:A/G-specific adenine glycosylase n=1 Tax=Helicobacter turcicus TaxID=2867412 RepID=A0ABS7JMV0_9HELI|nr:A/G-specific adenine glycosylase [Helicobacter turcicus]MBX7490726.1 A/G-specific adenine glycosylase [Helicobacter turcicus]MBX7545665.1 A/G-specific adenine glycosylase [Helicobacter turcicus]
MQVKEFQNTLLSWYKVKGRHTLPWRNKTIPNRAYVVLISEIMLQQTQVKVVLERYFFPFLEKFPNLEALSQAKEEDILLSWQGLGYYTRPRNLQKLAKICAKTGLPREVESLIKLPGIGAYTAGAIACFGYDVSVSFVDSNIKRILIRLFALKNPSQKQLEQKAKAILNLQDSFNHNQALLDLGALICTAKSPKCTICPISKFCQGKDFWQTLTIKTQKRNLKKSLHLAICIKDSKIALIKSTQKLYFGLYNFPEISHSMTHQQIGILKHAYTKYTLKVHCYITQQSAIANSKAEFFHTDSLDSIPLSSLALKVIKLLQVKNILKSPL